MASTVTPPAQAVRRHPCGDFLANIQHTDIGTAIFVNTIKTDNAESLKARHPLHGIGTPEDVVGAANLLASHEARWITGALLPVDGGFTAQ